MTAQTTKTLTEACAVLNEHKHLGFTDWRLARSGHIPEYVLSPYSQNTRSEFEAVAIAREYQREEGSTSERRGKMKRNKFNLFSIIDAASAGGVNGIGFVIEGIEADRARLRVHLWWWHLIIRKSHKY